MTEPAKKYPYKFSIVSAVYKVEEYLEEFIESLLGQTLDFEQHVQLILVDDGSPDASGAICDRYAARYPHNIKVVHKENGGVSSARNAGLALVEGEYVNFCDPDDKLSPTTLEAVYAFFEAHRGETDVVSIPLELFGDEHGPHILNNKFDGGDRVISLEAEWQVLQLTIASAFVRREAAERIRFNPALSIAEDAEQLMRLLIQKPYLGVVTGGTYYYRRRATSALGTSLQSKKWYVDSVRGFSLRVLDAARAHYGYVPKFVQNAVAYDLQWKQIAPHDPLTVLSREELADMHAAVAEVMGQIDADVMLIQPYLWHEVAWKFLVERTQGARFVPADGGDICYGDADAVVHRFSENVTEWSTVEISDDTLTLCLRQSVLCGLEQPDGVFLRLNGERVDACRTDRAKHIVSLGMAIADHVICRFEIPRASLQKKNRITVHCAVAGREIEMKNTVSGALFPLEKQYVSAYCRKNGWMLAFDGHALTVGVCTAGAALRREVRFLRELWKSGTFGAKKAVAARLLARMYKLFCRREVWIVSDRINKGGDNGEAFFRYLKSVGYKRAKYCFAVNHGSSYDALAPLGDVVSPDSWKYKVLFLAATKIISSQADDNVTNPFDYYSAPYKDIMNTKEFVFLQHGVTKDDISGWLNKYNKNIRGFICAARPEYDSILNTPTYFYTEREVWLTGFARFDRLYRDEKRYITLMPTWRKHLMTDMDKQTGIWRASAGFAASTYFKFYNSLINDERLLQAAEQYGYTLCYMPHPITLPQIDLFHHDPRVKFFTPDDQYRDVYAHSDLILTDYSSAVFDFAYLRKPVVYAQFDKAEFFENHTYTEGYFDYERDGFGEVTYDLDSTVAVLIDYMKNGCALKDVYRARVDGFFAFDDRDNCKRILEKIENME
ncbi:MAG: CDP-glycerol glycerophosphotransferase family protein [Clostridia bacterium]|nr:CDP-glycerol glycerophosphotransferase family protein [Clostridia bacterium]